MRASGPLHPNREDGSPLDATFEVSEVPVFDLVFHHKAGGRDSPRSVNADYHDALEILLDRLASVRATLLGISVDSAVARDLEPAKRQLDLDFPLRLGSHTDVPELRLDITRAEKPVARRSGTKAGGGNDQNRIRITLTVEASKSFDSLVELLSDGT